MAHPRRFRWLVAGALLTTGVVFGAGAGSASASGVTSVTGSAYGYYAYKITLFGSAQPKTGPTPQVKLTSNASNSPQNASATTGLVQYGPATLFTSDAITVHSDGSVGSAGAVHSSTSVNDINKATTQPSTGSEILTADNISGSCSASLSGRSGSTTITNGTLQTDSGLDLNNDGNYTDPGEHPPVVVSLPTNPPKNYTVQGIIYLSSTSTDHFVVVFNQQTVANGVLTENPVHEYLGSKLSSTGKIVTDKGSTLHGNLVIGQAVCGVA